MATLDARNAEVMPKNRDGSITVDSAGWNSEGVDQTSEYAPGTQIDRDGQGFLSVTGFEAPPPSPFSGSRDVAYFGGVTPAGQYKAEKDAFSWAQAYGRAMNNYGVAGMYGDQAKSAHEALSRARGNYGAAYESGAYERDARRQYLDQINAQRSALGRLANAPSVVQAEALAQRQALSRQIQSQLASQRGGYNPSSFRAAQAALSGGGQEMAARVVAARAQEDIARKQLILQGEQGISSSLGAMRDADLRRMGGDIGLGSQGFQEQMAARQSAEQAAQSWTQVGLADRNSVINQQLQKYGIQAGVGVEQAAQEAGMIQSGVGAGVGALSALASLAALSDRRTKKDISSGADPVRDFLDSISEQSYRYKGEPASAPKRIGVMAQDMERTPMGGAAIVPVPDPLSGQPMRGIDHGAAISASLASLANLNRRLSAVEGRK